MIRGDDLARFWSKTRPDGDCVIWTAGVCKDGYGKFATGIGGRRQRHRDLAGEKVLRRAIERVLDGRKEDG